MNQEKKWHLILTPENREEKIIELLAKKNIDTYFPLTRLSNPKWREKFIITHSAIFPSRLFVNITQEELLNVKQTKGCQHFVYWLNNPAIISQDDINAMKTFLKLYPDVYAKKAYFKPIIDEEKIKENCETNKVSIETGEHDKIFLSTLGFYIVAPVIIPVQEKLVLSQIEENQKKSFRLSFD